MTLILRSESAIFSKFFGYSALYGISTGRVGVYMFGANGGLSNIIGGNSLVPIGAPVINSDSFVGGKTNGYDTGLPDSADFTYIAVAKRMAGKVQLVGNINNVTTDPDVGAMIFQSGGSFGLSAPAINASLGVAKAMSASAVDDVCFFAGTCTGNTITAYFGHANALDSITYTGGARQTDPAETLKIGAHNYSGLYLDAAEIFMAGIHNVGLSAGDIATIYQDLRAQFASKGIPGL